MLCFRDSNEAFDSRSKPNGQQMDEMLGYLDQNRNLAKKFSITRNINQFDAISQEAWSKLVNHVNAFGTFRTAEQWHRTWLDLLRRGINSCQRVVNGFEKDEPFYHLRYAYNIDKDLLNPHIRDAAIEFQNRPLASTLASTQTGYSAWYTQAPTQAPTTQPTPRYQYVTNQSPTTSTFKSSGAYKAARPGSLLTNNRFNSYNHPINDDQLHSDEETPKKKVPKRRSAPKKAVEFSQIESKVNEMLQPIVHSVENRLDGLKEELKDELGALVEVRMRRVLQELLPPNKVEEPTPGDKAGVRKADHNSDLSDDELPPVPDFTRKGRYTPVYAEDEFGEFIVIQVS